MLLCGPGCSSGKVLDYRLDGMSLIPGVRGGGDFSSLLCVQTGPGIHSTSYKMSTRGLSPWVKEAKSVAMRGETIRAS